MAIAKVYDLAISENQFEAEKAQAIADFHHCGHAEAKQGSEYGAKGSQSNEQGGRADRPTETNDLCADPVGPTCY
jgi:hypothetical protein